MSKFWFTFIQFQIDSGSLHTKHTLTKMSKRSSFHRAPKFKPEVKATNNRPKYSVTMSSRKEKVQVLPEPIKSVSDKKLYKTIRLENGLTALLISDPSRQFIADENTSSEEETSGSDDSSGQDSDGSKSAQSAASDQHGSKKRAEFDEEKLAACALSVGVGSYSDPPEIQGLAHFVEHMVFMGSEKYPKENEFDSFIKKKGGSDNASTDCEITTFYFEIQEKHLPQAMDIFSQFFVSPLMKKEAMQREREAIQSEFAIAAPSDSNRKDQLLSSTFPAGHPARTFTWGDERSLRERVADDALHAAAHAFRARHYSAHRMTVAVQARMELSALEQYVVNTFGQIPTNKLPADDFTEFAFKPDMVTPEFKSLYYIKPVSDTTEVHLTWCMRSLISEYESKPHQYISYLLGHEGKGSLLSYLKNRIWALGIYTGNSESGIDYTSMYSLFSIQVVLTKDGLEHVDEVLEAIFSYINMLKKIGPSERIYKELKMIEETSFRFEAESQPADYVEALAENMHFFPPEHYISGDKLYYKFDPKRITELLDCMSADMVNIMILSNKHSTPIQYDAKEEWFGTEYKKIEKPKAWLEKWLNVEPYNDFHLPEKNIYITTNFDLIPPAPPYLEEAEKLGVDLKNSSVKDIHKKVSSSERETKVLTQGDLMATVNNFRLDQPNLLRKNRHMELWYKPDFKFRLPTALLYFYFITPLSLRSPREACLMDLWTDVMQQGLKEQVYPANMADLAHSLYVSDKGFTLKVSGYNQNLHLLVSLVGRELRAGAALPGALFGAVRDVRARLYHNVLIKPHKLAKDIRMNVLLEPYISPRDKAAVIHNITLADLQDFSERLLDKLYLQVLVQGNIPWHEAIRISENLLDTIKWKPLEENEFPEVRVHRLPRGERRVRVRSLNAASTNSIVTNYYQGDASSPKHTAALEVLMMLMEEPVFDVLRTKEQLGYSVFSMMRYTFGVLGFSVTVNTQVDKFSVSHVDQRVEAFLKKFARDTRRGGERALAAARHALTQLKHTTDYELKEEVERNWREIISREYQFQRLFIEAEAIEQIRLADVKSWIDDHFGSGNKSQFRKLSIQIVGNKPKDDNEISDEQPKNLTLHYLKGNEGAMENSADESDVDFIEDIDQFKKDLPLIDVPKVELAQC